MWYFRKHHPKFIAKKELSKNIPSLSFALRNGGHTFIDRKSGDAAVQEVYKLGETIEKNNWSVCIYPEGTRSYNGVVKRFQHGGTRSLITASPSALIVPLAIKNNYKLQPNKYFMFDLGVTMEFVVLEPIDPVDLTPEEAINKAELLIKQELKQA
jgi:1-acyl-sn-glycerol-3-phosphate acyltransferase